MSSDFAGCGATQSGQRFLDSSAPRLIRHAASSETAGGDLISSPAGKDQKLSWGAGQSPVIFARGARVPSFLVSYTNNRDALQSDLAAMPEGRGKHCGRFSIQGSDPKSGRVRFRRVNCGCWTCFYCGPRRARRAKRAIRTVAEELGLSRFLTLTLDPSKVKCSGKESVPYLRECFDKFRRYLRRRFGEAPRYVCIVEFTKNGVPHLHILIDRYIEQAWISSVWERLGGGWRVDIRRVTVRNVSRYLAKYLTKDLLLSAPKGTRRITTARSIRLFPKFKSEINWEFVRATIWSLYSYHSQADSNRGSQPSRVVEAERDEEQFLTAFAIRIQADSAPL